MKLVKTVLTYGFLIWVIPFLAAMFLFSVHESNRPLFESIMSVVLAASIIFFTAKYFKKIEEKFFRESIFLGLTWLTISLVLDFPMFSIGPMKMNLSGYVSDIGLTYLMIPIIVIGIGYILEDRNKKADKVIKL
jgi:hypothetical protein